jgi:CubicO group peptidase (beta-lactamase class C family)
MNSIVGRCLMRRVMLPAAGMLAAILTISASAQQPPPQLPEPAKTDPNALGLMQGFPPSAGKTVRFDDGTMWKFPMTRWSFSHMRELVPTAAVRRGLGPPSSLPRAEKNLDAIRFQATSGEEMIFAEALAKTYTDGVLVLHKGRIAYEKYFGAGAADRPHAAMSVTKSFVGTLAAMLVADGKLDPSAPVTQYVPELKDSAYGDATVRQVMDMLIGVKFSENYADPNAETWAYGRAGGLVARGPDYAGPRTFYDFLVGLKKEGEHGQAFGYKTANAEVLAWIVKRAGGKSLADLLSETIWSKLGAEHDAYFAVDGVGTESGGGGLSATLRDLARFGEMMRNDGRLDGRQIVAASAVADIRNGGDKGKFAKANYRTLPGWSYRNMWWVSHNEHGAYMARGIHGQNIYIDPKAELVIVRFGSHPIAANPFTDPIMLPAYAAVAQSLVE